MKNKIFGLLFLLGGLVFGLASVASGNVMEGLLAVGSVATGVSYVVPTSLLGNFDATLFCVPFSNLKRADCNAVSPGGMKKILVQQKEDFTTEWPKKADITAGVITVAPPTAALKTWAVLDFVPNTAKFDSIMEGDEGFHSFKHSLVFDCNGYSGAQNAALEKFLNNQGVFVCQQNDGRIIVLGNSIQGLDLKSNGTSDLAAKGKRQYKCSGDRDGLQFHAPELTQAMFSALLLSAV
jgi:hypothetical protein